MEGSVDEVPGKPSKKRDSPAGPFRRPSTGARRRTPGKRKPSGGQSKTSTPAAGTGIGPYQRRGVKLAGKFAALISVMIAVISILFGFGVVTLFQRKLKSEIIRYGYERALSMRELGRRVFENYKNDRDYMDEGNAVRTEDMKALENVVEFEQRIYGIAIYSHDVHKNQRPSPNPSGLVMSAGKVPKSFTRPPAETISVPLDHADHTVQVWAGEMKIDETYVEAMFFRVPTDMQGENRLATVNLAISQATINDAVKSLVPPVLLVGAMFVILGIIVAQRLAKVVTQPVSGLVEDLDVVARGDLEHQARVQSQDEIGVLARAVNRMVRGLREAKDREEEMHRLNADLSLANEIMTNLMPKKVPNLPGYDVYPMYQSAKEVGGDYYDFIPVDDKHIAFVIADVSGKSVGGALVAGTTRTILRMMSPMNLSPADVLAKTNYHVYRDIRRGMFVTAMYILLNAVTREIVVASAGHNPLVVWRADTGKQEWINPNGIALGFDKGPLFARTIMEKKTSLRRGDRVFVYTDGVVEAMNVQGEEWGMKALKKFVSKNAELSSQEFCEKLLKELERHKGKAEQHDDITFTTIRVT